MNKNTYILNIKSNNKLGEKVRLIKLSTITMIKQNFIIKQFEFESGKLASSRK